ncbi:hypothetical protein [Actinocrispum sp. NPDC049592]|uniref:hypothetical protein n=1 Tax=Actinocrispum sp. NPDC049592 TaxID=3154835 RepID=UPI0034177B24
MRIRSIAAAGSLALATFALPTVTGLGAQAFAVCPEVGQVSYTISNGAKVWQATNLHSDYLTGPGTITYSKNTTSTVNASITGTTSAEAGVIFAKASVSLSVTVGGSYSKSDTWSYSATVPAGQTKKLQQYKDARSFTVKKTQIVAPCNVKTVWTKKVTAPVKNNVYKWALAS